MSQRKYSAYSDALYDVNLVEHPNPPKDDCYPCKELMSLRILRCCTDSLAYFSLLNLATFLSILMLSEAFESPTAYESTIVNAMKDLNWQLYELLFCAAAVLWALRLLLDWAHKGSMKNMLWLAPQCILLLIFSTIVQAVETIRWSQNTKQSLPILKHFFWGLAMYAHRFINSCCDTSIY